MKNSIIELSFEDDGEPPCGYTQGHITINLASRFSTLDDGYTCMILPSASTLLGQLIAMFSPPYRKALEAGMIDLPSADLFLEKLGDDVKLSTCSGKPIGVTPGIPFIHAVAAEVAKLEALAVKDRDNAAMNDAASLRLEVAKLFPRRN